tara:strand:- start:106 stop:516 length:411 start_codon:yes stop_codon:yes gene_type:complete
MQTKTHLKEKLLYGPFKFGRLSWHLFHHIASKKSSVNFIKKNLHLPNIGELLFDISKVFYKEFIDINNRIYHVLLSIKTNPIHSFLKSMQYFNDLSIINNKRKINDNQDITFKTKNSKNFLTIINKVFISNLENIF